MGFWAWGFSGRGFRVRDFGRRVQSSKFSDLAFRGSGLGCRERESERERERARERERERLRGLVI